MKVFGTFVTAPDLAELAHIPHAEIYGRGVFARRFFDQLLRLADFDQYHFYQVGPGHAPQPGDFAAGDARLGVYPIREFARRAREVDYAVLHNVWGPDIGPWTELRNRVCEVGFPVTGLIHSVGFQSFAPRLLASMAMGVRPWDSIVCTTEPGRVVMRNWIAHLRREFEREVGCGLRYEGRLDRIPLAIDAQVFRPRERAPLRRALGLPEGDVLLLGVGRFSPYDKMDLFPLLLAFRRALDLGPPVAASLLLAGADAGHGYAHRVEAFAAELGLGGRVLTRTNVDDDSLPGLYAAADVFVSPSDNIQETFGQALIEAMAAGLPVVCSDWDGYRDLVVHGRTGYRVPTAWLECDRELCDYAALGHWMPDHFALSQTVSVDVEALARALRRLIDDRPRREELGAEGRRRALQLYDWPVVVRQYLDLWDELKAQSRVAPVSAPVPRSWYRPPYFELFRHYASARVEDATRVRAAPAPAAVRWYEELDGRLSSELLAALLAGAADWVEVGRLREQVCAACAAEPQEFGRHLMWALKYALLVSDPGTLEGDVRALEIDPPA